MKKITILFFIILAIACYPSKKTFSQDLEHDSLALVDLYNSTNGPSWTNHTNWLTGNVADWYGITLSFDGANYRVITINLSNNNLNGTIPSSIGTISTLINLILNNNSLTGSIPNSIGDLSNLGYLYLNHNSLTGSIPSSIGNLTLLLHLYLNNNSLSGEIPSTINNCTNLNYLSFRKNQLTGALPSISHLEALNFIHLDTNYITSLPGHIKDSINLSYLYVKNNRLTFESIEPNLSEYLYFYYSPQDSVLEERDTTIMEGKPLSMEFTVGGTSNVYSFYKDGEFLFETDDPIIGFSEAALSDSGAYSCHITNTLATELTLISRPYFIHIAKDFRKYDSLALVDLYNSTNGLEWTQDSNWLAPGKTIDQWHGITVEGNRVTQVKLDNNHLKGTLPTSIGNLTELEYLWLRSDSISGAIPSTINNCADLLEIRLDNNQITSIPTQLSELPNLQHLSLYRNNLSGTIPVELGNITSLSYLDLGYNQFSGSIPPEIGNLSNLENFYLNDNSLAGNVPAAFGNLTKLRWFELQNNNINGTLPSGIADWDDLEYFRAYNNNFTGGLDSLQNLSKLIEVDVRGNHFTTLPDFSAISSLTTLAVDTNNIGSFEGIEANLRLPGKSFYTFTYNGQDSIGQKLDTTIVVGQPAELIFTVGGDSNVYQLFKNGSSAGIINRTGIFSNPAFSFSDSGTYACSIANTLVTSPSLILTTRPITIHVAPNARMVDSLALVDLYNSTNGPEWVQDSNWLVGPINTWHGIAINPVSERVTLIQLVNNHLNGTLPESLGNLSKLEVVILSINDSLRGTIPASIGNLKDLTELRLNGNLFDSIPNEITGCTNLETFSLEDNNFSGSIPSMLFNITSLTMLDISFNDFSGTIPAEVGSLSNLELLYFNDNNLSGSLPPEIGNLTKLTFLQVHNNDLGGTLPVELANLDSLRFFRVYNNDFTGSLDCLSSLPNLVSVETSNNLFTNLPDLSDVSTLTDLYVNGNSIGSFEGIESNLRTGQLEYFFLYADQDSLGEAIDTTVLVGSTFTFDFTVGGTYNKYSLYKDGDLITTASSGVFVSPPITLSDSGIYTGAIRNDSATLLTLYTRPIFIHVETEVGISNEGNNNTLSIYPNPSDGKFTIFGNIDKSTTLEIHNAFGQLVSKEVFNNSTSKRVDLTNNPKGIYFVKLTNADLVKTWKVVVK